MNEKLSDGTELKTRAKSESKTAAKISSVEKSLLRRKLINHEFVDFISVLSLEELIALKMEISCEKFEGTLYGIPLYNSMYYLIMEMVMKFTLSVSQTTAQAALILGISRKKFTELIKIYKLLNDIAPPKEKKDED